METLVRRLGRIFSLTKKNKGNTPSQRTLRRMDALERTLSAWLENKGWRVTVRTVGEAAERLDTDTGILHAYFRERVGMDFRTWRTRLRLEDAKRMLLDNPAMEAAEIARRTGFSNRSNFARQFQAYLGCTPAQWRKEARISRDSRAPENDYA